MRNFDYESLAQAAWIPNILDFVALISQEKGKQEFYLKQMPEELESLVEITKVRSTEASNAIEGIHTSSTRLKKLMGEEATPKSRDEEEIAGYRDALALIHESFDMISITPNYILQLHRILMGHTSVSHKGKFKNVQNYISATDENGHSFTLFTPLDPFETPLAMERICDEYNRCIGNGLVHPLVLIPVFIHDFLCIHPFIDGNGRMSRLLTTLLLYRSGFNVGKYISLEAKIFKNKDFYYEALGKSQVGWHEGKENPLPFVKYLLGTIASAYADLGDRVAILSEKLPAKEMVRKAVDLKMGSFSKADIMELCPSLSLSSVELALRELVEEGAIEKSGVGKATRYHKASHL